MKWATRAHIHIDRAACAWLIRRWVDPEAVFVFVGEVDDVPPGTTAFDMAGVDLTHHNGDCTFETILRRYDLYDPALWRIAAAVHEADLDDERFAAPEALGFDVILRALSMTFDDDRVVELSGAIFDALYGYYRRELELGREPA